MRSPYFPRPEHAWRKGRNESANCRDLNGGNTYVGFPVTLGRFRREAKTTCQIRGSLRAVHGRPLRIFDRNRSVCRPIRNDLRSPNSPARCATQAARRNKFLLLKTGAVNSPLPLRKGGRMKVRGFFELAKSGGQLAICSASIAALLAGCEKNSEIKVYRVSKAPLEESAPQQQDAMPTNTAAPRMPGGLAPTAQTAVTTPPNWEPQPLSQMRQASFLVKGDNGAIADVSFVSLGSAAGNVLDNVNRWLGQLGQPPITEQKLGEMAQRLHTSLGDVTIVDLAGLPDNADPARDGRIIAAMVTTDNATLFFKMRGNADLTEAQKSEFIKWVAGVCNGQTQPEPPQMPGAQSQTTTTVQIKWKTPEGWTEVPASSMRYASFSAPTEDGGKIDISVVTFPGDGGSDADNINRWR